jgi:hypothetical protein
VHQVRFKQFAGNFPAAQQIGGGRLYGGVRSSNLQLRLLIFFLRGGFALVQHNNDQRFGFQF